MSRCLLWDGFFFFLEKSMSFIESVVKDRSNSRNSSRV